MITKSREGCSTTKLRLITECFSLMYSRIVNYILNGGNMATRRSNNDDRYGVPKRENYGRQ